MRDIKAYLNEIKSRSAPSGYKAVNDVTLPGGQVARLVLMRRRFMWRDLSRITELIVVAEYDKADIADIQALADAAIAYFRKTVRFVLPPGLHHFVSVIPCVAAKTFTPEAGKYASSPPRRHWIVGELPVLYDLGTGEAHYFRGYRYYTFYYMRGMQEAAKEILEGDSPESEVDTVDFDATAYDKRKLINPEYRPALIVVAGAAIGLGVMYWYGHRSLSLPPMLITGAGLLAFGLMGVFIVRAVNRIRKKHVGYAVQAGAVVCLVLYFGSCAVEYGGQFLVSLLWLLAIMYGVLFVLLHIGEWFRRRKI